MRNVCGTKYALNTYLSYDYLIHNVSEVSGVQYSRNPMLGKSLGENVFSISNYDARSLRPLTHFLSLYLG